jgi:hypothetical protein
MGARALTALGLAAALAAGGLAIAPACSRHADIVDEPDVTIAPTATFQPDAEIPMLDAALGPDAFAACADRPLGPCGGHGDFPCAFRTWAENAAAACQQATHCEASGWLVIAMGDDGCVSGIGMEQPHKSFADCMVAELGQYTCPCKQGLFEQYLIPAPGCAPLCGVGEFPCPPGYACGDGGRCFKR